MLIQEYTTSWAFNFQAIIAMLSDALLNIPVSIEHIGSTAVPGLAAKPIIDVDIFFQNSSDFSTIKIRLEKAGYYHNGNQGIQDREVFKRVPTYTDNNALNTIAHHLYVCSADCEELKRHILFRNYLRANTEARNEYQQLKQQLAAEANHDRKLYAQLKEEKAKAFIESVIARASL
nr:GrpB family protein [uncultured Lacibacter sp.]